MYYCIDLGILNVRTKILVKLHIKYIIQNISNVEIEKNKQPTINYVHTENVLTDKEPQDALTEDGYRPTPDENDTVTITLEIGEEAPIYLIDFNFWNGDKGTDLIVTVKNDTLGVVEVREVRYFLCAVSLFFVI